MAKKPSEVKETIEVKETKKVIDPNDVKRTKKVMETNESIETNEVKKTKVKRLPKGQRKHIRRMKQTERKEAIIVNPK